AAEYRYLSRSCAAPHDPVPRCERSAARGLKLRIRRQSRIGAMGLALIPEGNRRDGLVNGPIDPVGADRLPTQALNRDPQIRLEPHRIGDVPAIKAEAGITFPVFGAQDLHQAGIGTGKRLILVAERADEVVGAVEVVFGAGAGDGGKLAVAIQEELDFAFAPPAALPDAIGHIGADILALTANAIQD